MSLDLAGRQFSDIVLRAEEQDSRLVRIARDDLVTAEQLVVTRVEQRRKRSANIKLLRDFNEDIEAQKHLSKKINDVIFNRQNSSVTDQFKAVVTECFERHKDAAYDVIIGRTDKVGHKDFIRYLVMLPFIKSNKNKFMALNDNALRESFVYSWRTLLTAKDGISAHYADRLMSMVASDLLYSKKPKIDFSDIEIGLVEAVTRRTRFAVREGDWGRFISNAEAKCPIVTLWRLIRSRNPVPVSRPA